MGGVALAGAEVLLTLDTATTAGSVALSRGDQLLGEVLIDTVATHSDRLLLQVRQLLGDLQVELAELTALAVVDGPGSFTGLRVGVATAKGLAAATGLPLIGVSTLDTLAAGLPWASLPVCALLDARRQEVYAACYAATADLPRLLAPPRALDPRLLLAEIDQPTLFVGSGAVAYRQLIGDTLGDLALFAPARLNLPRASCAAPLALAQLRRGEASTAALLQPRYLRAAL